MNPLNIKPHKIRNVDIEICNAEQKIAYNYLSTYYNSMSRFNLLDYCQKCLARDAGNKKYNVDLVYHYILSSYDRFINAKYHILTSYEAIGELIR